MERQKVENYEVDAQALQKWLNLLFPDIVLPPAQQFMELGVCGEGKVKGITL
jgi:hypothetical protein